MKKEKTFDDKNFWRGVSTLDFAARSLRQSILLLMLSLLFAGFADAKNGHSILDAVDPSFDPQIRTSSFSNKQVYATELLPGGKILAAGYFNSYNRLPVGGLIRLNADASLDTTFNNNLLTTNNTSFKIILQPDGKIILYGSSIALNGQTSTPNSLIRLNSDGTPDPSFNFTAGGPVVDAAIDSGGRLLVTRRFSTAGGSGVVIRLNSDGSQDSSFRFVPTETISDALLAIQNNKVIVAQRNPSILKRLNEDGSIDSSFTPITNAFHWLKIIVQPDNKILALDNRNLRRLNEDGSADNSFQPTNFSPLDSFTMRLAEDGRIIVVFSNGFIRKFLPNGMSDSTFSQYNHPGFGSLAIRPDGSLIVGDFYIGGTTPGRNAFVRLLPDGSLDTSFNPSGIGFQTMGFGSVWAIGIQADGKVFIGGKFDEVNDLPRPKLARLNADSTVDASFQLNTSGTGNYFSQIINVYNIAVQPDGKILVTGNFTYWLNGVQKGNIVRFNADGSIDASFNLSNFINDTFASSGGGKNRFVTLSDGKIIVGTSRLSSLERAVPIRLNSNGVLDTTFSSTVFSGSNAVLIMDVAVQPDGKIIIGGRHTVLDTVPGSILKSFIARLNPDGSLDPSFQVNEELNREISTFKLLGDGKILIAKLDSPQSFAAQQSSIFRLNGDGSVDNSFNAVTSINGKINALLLLPSGKTMVGGRFTTFGGQPRGNMALVNADGTLDPTTFNVNQEVLCLTLDGDGRVLVGGDFTAISVAGGQNHPRSYVARIIDSSVAEPTRFDFDGDGRADLAVFSASNGNWTIRNSRTNQVSDTQFGQSGDKTVAADFDADGRADLAVYRPAQGVWYLLQSTAGFAAVRWGVSEDKPVPADYDGDGRADVAVWRPSSGVWYILQSSNNQMRSLQFGQFGDVALSDTDFDNDGRADIAVFRPASGTFYWLASGIGNQFKAVQFGQTGDIPAVGDFNGDGKTDLVVFRPTNGVWYQYLTTQDVGYTFAATQFGQNGDEPVAADYNGDGKADIAVRRQGVWHLLMSGQNYANAVFGAVTAQAIAALPNNSPCSVGTTQIGVPCPPGCVCIQ